MAIRLTGQKAPTSELIALALPHANCRQTGEAGNCWTPLDAGFLIPVDEVLDLITPLSLRDIDEQEPEGGPWAARARPDLIYVSFLPRRGLSIAFIEIEYVGMCELREGTMPSRREERPVGEGGSRECVN